MGESAGCVFSSQKREVESFHFPTMFHISCFSCHVTLCRSSSVPPEMIDSESIGRLKGSQMVVWVTGFAFLGSVLNSAGLTNPDHCP